MTLTVVGARGGVATLTLWLANQPGDINQDGMTDMADATAFGEEWYGARRLERLDLNGDGVVDIRDATTFGRIWSGILPDATQPWANTSLPERPN